MKQITTVILLLITTITFSQVKMEGVVKDSIGNPLELANVIAINKATQALESYAITNDKGQYRLDLEKNTTYKLQISYIGFKSIDEEFTTKEENIKRDFVLKEDEAALDAVELTYELPVTISGDTITYNADSFKKETDRKLGDVLQNTPGIEVNEDGQVEVEGKPVNKLLVDGKEFFDGDTKLGVQNIPANAVDKIQVLKNFAEVGQLRNVQNNQDNIALNIKLKEGKKNFWFGDVTLGGGGSSRVPQDQGPETITLPDGTQLDNTRPDGLYLFQPKLFYYSPKTSINVIGDFNNLGEQAFTRRDIFNFTGGFRPPSNQSGTLINLGNNNLGFLTQQQNRAQEITNHLGAVNITHAPNSKLNIGGFAIFLNSEVELQQNNSTQFNQIAGNTNIPPDENTESRTRQRSNLLVSKFNINYTPNPNNQLDYEVQGRLTNEDQTQNFLSSVTGNTNEFEEATPYSITQRLNYYYTLNENNIFALEAQHVLSDEDPFYNALLQNDPDGDDAFDNTAIGLGLNPTLNNFNISQERRVRSNQLDAKLDYWHILNQKSNINLTGGVIVSRQDFDSDIFQIIDNNGTRLNPTPINGDAATNDIEYNFTDLYLGAHYRLKSGKFTFTPGFTAHAYSVNNSQFGNVFDDDFFRILPDLNIRFDIKNSENLTLNYNLQTQFNDVTRFAQGLVLNNFNSIFTGNPQLENALVNSVRLNYFKFDLFNYTNIFAFINYTNRVDQVRNQTNFASVIRTNTAFNSPFADESLTASGRFQRTFNKIQASIRGIFNYSRFNQFIQEIRSTNENFTQSYTGEIRTNFRTAPNITFRYTYSVQDNDQGNTRTQFFTNAPSIVFDAYIFKKVTFRTNYTFNNFRDDNNTIDNTFQFWDASLSYRESNDSKLEFELKATNLLDTRSLSNSSAGQISVNASEFFIQPRYLSFRMIYNL